MERHEFRLRGPNLSYVATLQRNGRWWIGWVDDVAGVNAQGESREALIENLGSALHEALEMR